MKSKRYSSSLGSLLFTMGLLLPLTDSGMLAPIKTTPAEAATPTTINTYVTTVSPTAASSRSNDSDYTSELSRYPML